MSEGFADVKACKCCVHVQNKLVVCQVSSELPKFYARYYRKHFGLFCSGHTVVVCVAVVYRVQPITTYVS